MPPLTEAQRQLEARRFAEAQAQQAAEDAQGA